MRFATDTTFKFQTCQVARVFDLLRITVFFLSLKKGVSTSETGVRGNKGPVHNVDAF